MKAVYLLTGAAVAAAIPGIAHAEAGDIQFKLLATLVAPDGQITELKNNAAGLPAGSQTKANDNVTPTIAVEYFLTDNVSIETIAGVTQHDVDGVAALSGAEAVADAKIVPATLTVKYHLPLGGGVKPYVGAGPSYFIFISEKPGSTTRALGATKTRLNDKVGVALQAGVDVAIGDSGVAVSLDAKRYFLRTDAFWFNASGTEVLRTRHKIDPWVISAGVAFKL